MSEEQGPSPKKRKTKSFTKKPDLDIIQQMVETQGLSKNTIDKRKAAKRKYNTLMCLIEGQARINWQGGIFFHNLIKGQVLIKRQGGIFFQI